MNRDLDRLTAQTFDLLVVGGGIYGLTIAYDAAQRGLATALIERDDFGSGASFNHLRTIHGGLRYLQTLDLRRARESVRERRTLARIAPHAVTPLAFVLPLTRSLTRGRLAVRAGFLLDRLIGFDRNRGVPRSHRLPPGRIVSRSDAAQRFPGLRRQGLTGAAVWHDYETIEPDRLTLAWAIGAAADGAVLANHVEARAPLVEGRRVVGVQAVDRLTGGALEIAARLTINATGGAMQSLLTPLAIDARLPLLKAMNLVTSREAGEQALGGRSPSGRNFFLVPWRGRAVFGTWESGATVAPDSVDARTAEVEAFVAELNQVFPSLDLSLADVTLVHRGVVPAVLHGNRPALEGHEQIRDHGAEGVEGLISIAGTKYTTARASAERIVTRALTRLGRPEIPSRSGTVPLPGGGLRDVGSTIAEARREHDAELPLDAIPHLVAAYGSRYRDLLEAAVDRPGWRERVAGGSPVIAAELVWAVRHEMALTLSDAVIRRTPLGALGYPGDQAASRAAELVGDESGWSADRRAREITALRKFYALPDRD
jgi:glycerol-3-phosphate dehydrogenase